MLTVPGPIQTLVDGGRFSIRFMIKFSLDSGDTGLWNDTYAVTYSSVTYAPLAGNVTFEGVPGTSELSSDTVRVQITNLLSAVTTIIANEVWHQRACVLNVAFLDDAGAIQHVMPLFSGFLDEVTLTDADGDLNTLTLMIESNNRELNRSSGRTRGDADQRRVLSSDGFFKHAANANSNTNIYWGRKGPQAPASSRD